MCVYIYMHPRVDAENHVHFSQNVQHGCSFSIGCGCLCSAAVEQWHHISKSLRIALSCCLDITPSPPKFHPSLPGKVWRSFRFAADTISVLTKTRSWKEATTDMFIFDFNSLCLVLGSQWSQMVPMLMGSSGLYI
jgi:hypothetical protein